MSGERTRRGFSARPTTPEAWVKAPDARAPADNPYTARLTIDVTPVLRGRIKITAFERGLTVADMLRALLEREFPDEFGGSR